MRSAIASRPCSTCSGRANGRASANVDCGAPWGNSATRGRNALAAAPHRPAGFFRGGLAGRPRNHPWRTKRAPGGRKSLPWRPGRPPGFLPGVLSLWRAATFHRRRSFPASGAARGAPILPTLGATSGAICRNSRVHVAPTFSNGAPVSVPTPRWRLCPRTRRVA